MTLKYVDVTYVQWTHGGGPINKIGSCELLNMLKTRKRRTFSGRRGEL